MQIDEDVMITDKKLVDTLIQLMPEHTSNDYEKDRTWFLENPDAVGHMIARMEQSGVFEGVMSKRRAGEGMWGVTHGFTKGALMPGWHERYTTVHCDRSLNRAVAHALISSHGTWVPTLPTAVKKTPEEVRDLYEKYEKALLTWNKSIWDMPEFHALKDCGRHGIKTLLQILKEKGGSMPLFDILTVVAEGSPVRTEGMYEGWSSVNMTVATKAWIHWAQQRKLLPGKPGPDPYPEDDEE